MDQNSSNQYTAQSNPVTSSIPTDQPGPMVPSQPVSVAEPQSVNASVANTIPATQQASYIEDMGGSLIILLQQINTNDELLAEVATEMELDTTKTKVILTNFLDKINHGQITQEDLALIMAAPVVETPHV